MKHIADFEPLSILSIHVKVPAMYFSDKMKNQKRFSTQRKEMIMTWKLHWVLFLGGAVVFTMSCQSDEKSSGSGNPQSQKDPRDMKSKAAKDEVRLITLDPGHFHAGLVQKYMYDQVSPTVHVYAPAGPDLQSHLDLIESFNTRPDNPTHWKEMVYTGPDFLEKMLKERPGNVVVLAGNNSKKTEYIKACVENGLNVFADKPMAIDANDFNLLAAAFDTAKKNHVLIYDIMTERSEITSQIHKALMNTPTVFGELTLGTVAAPAVEIRSTHHFFKNVAGKPLKRPGWFFDTTQQGEGLVDVTTHLVDISMWECFPNQAIDYHKDIVLKAARRWPTPITREQFKNATQIDGFPDYLKGALDPQGVLACYSNGEMVYTLRGVHVKVGVEWSYQAPPGAGDTYFCAARGSKANIYIRQGQEQNFEPEVYVEPAAGTDPKVLEKDLTAAVKQMEQTYPGIGVTAKDGQWQITITKELRIGHEQHFRQVTLRYLQYLKDGKLPDWEVPNMITKYYITTHALEMAMKKP
jgi:predicted dehydrogenase